MNEKRGEKGVTGKVLSTRNMVMSLAQRKDIPSIRELVNDLRRDRSVRLIDQALVLHHSSQFAELNDMVMDLVHLGCNIYFTDMHGDNVVHYLVRGCNYNLLRLLVQNKGPEVLAHSNHAQFNPVLTACAESPDDRAYEILNILEYLYLNGVSLESQDHQGKTGLLWAAQRGSLVVVQWMLSRGANLAHRDHCERTAMHLAAMNGDEETVLLMAEKGGYNFVNAQSIDDKRVRTPLDICIRRGHYYLVGQMKMWAVTKRFLGRLVLFRNMYAWCYWFMSLFNLGMAISLTIDVLTRKKNFWPASLCFFFSWLMQAICWIIAFNADPGFAKHIVIPDQSKRCSTSFSQDMHKLPVFRGDKGSATQALHTLERDALKVNQDLIELNRKYRGKKYGGEDEFENCASRLDAIREGMNRLIERVGIERQSKCPKGYAKAVLDGRTKGVCLTCQMIKPFRVHHCSDCANCIHRFDHHCIWLDNCIGKGNQRSFWFFLLFTSTGIMSFWALFLLYVQAAVEDRSGINYRLSDIRGLVNIPNFYLSSTAVLLNVMWFVFVSYLFIRTTKSMVTNITFYEHLRRPAHIQNRFDGEAYGCFWDMRDLTCGSLFKNIWSFCTLDERSDVETYLPLKNHKGHAGRKAR